jgi:hypothetical protein
MKFRNNRGRFTTEIYLKQFVVNKYTWISYVHRSDTRGTN